MAFAAAVAACVFYALVSLWEVGTPLVGGHFAAPAWTAISGENLNRWKVFAFVPHYVTVAPTIPYYYTHHPYGLVVTSAFFDAIFGHQWLTTRLPAAIFSILSPVLVYRIGRTIWPGVVPAAVATVAFVSVPIDLAYCNTFNLEVPTIFSGLLFTWGTVRHWKTWKRRYLLAATVGALGAAQFDWVGSVIVGSVVGFAFVRAYVLPRRWFGRLNDREHARWFAFAVSVTVGTVLLYLVLFAKADRLGDLLNSYNQRSEGTALPVKIVFGERRLMWIFWMITPVGLIAMCVGLVASLERFFRRGDPYAWMMPAWMIAANFQYFAFKQAADVHIFWPHYYGPCVALGCGAFASSLLIFGEYVSSRISPLRVRPLIAVRLVTAGVFAVLILLPVAALARVGVPMLTQSRDTGGRFDDGGRHIDNDRDKSVFVEWAQRDMPAAQTLALVGNFGDAGGNVEFAAHRPVTVVNLPLQPVPLDSTERIAIIDARRVGPSELKVVAQNFGATIVGPFWKVDRAGGKKPLVAMRYDEHQPHGLEWLYGPGTDLVRKIGPNEDPFATWEWNHHFGLPTDSPHIAPLTLEDVRIAHNIALARGDMAAAKAMRTKLEASFAGTLHLDYSGDIHLLGMTVDKGAAVVFSLYWEAGPKFVPFEGDYLVRSKVDAPPALWPSAIDYFEKEVAPFCPLRPSLYRPGFIYTQRFLAMRRVGKERFYGFFAGGPTKPALPSGAESVDLVTLP